MARLSILTQDEINALYTIPPLDDEEQSFLFSLDIDDVAILESFDNNTARKVDYILQLGYYRAINYFFFFSFQKVKADVTFIMQLYFPEEPFPKKQVSKSSHYRNRCEVMNKFGLKEVDTDFQSQLLKEAKALVQTTRPIEVCVGRLADLLPTTKCHQASLFKLTGYCDYRASR